MQHSRLIGFLVVSLLSISAIGWGEQLPTDGRPSTGGIEAPSSSCRDPLDLNCIDFSCVAPQQADSICLSMPSRPERPTRPLPPRPGGAEAPGGRPTDAVVSLPSRPAAEAPAGRPTAPAMPLPTPPIGALEIRPVERIPLSGSCDCPEPQPISSEGVCTDRLDQLPCLHHEQAAELAEKGYLFDTVDLPDGRIGYEITTPQHPPFVLPECRCDAPEMPAPPETPLTTPESEVPSKAPGPEFLTELADQVYLCRTGMPLAVGVSSGREIPIASCPQLPREQVVQPFHVSLTREFERYLGNRQPGQLEVVRQKAETILKGWTEREPEYLSYPIVAAEVSPDETETAAEEGEPVVDLIDIDPEDIEIVDSSEKGHGPVIHVTIPRPHAGSHEDREKGESDAAAIATTSSDTSDSLTDEGVRETDMRAVVIVPTEYLHSQGGCSLVR